MKIPPILQVKALWPLERAVLGERGSIPGSPPALGDSLLQHVSPAMKGKLPYLPWILPSHNFWR